MIIGTAGHIDHGKTTLVKALTGTDCDRLREEKERGITLDLGYAFRPVPNPGMAEPVLGFIDVPGHEKLVHNMLAGATGIDFALLVIAADDGPMPQTREHLDIIDLLGIGQGAIALTKTALVSPQRLASVTEEIRLLLEGTELSGAPIFPVDAPAGIGIPALQTHLEAVARQHTARVVQGRFRLSVDRAFSLSGTGTVVTGTALSGRVAIGATLLLSPGGHSVRVRSLRVQGQIAESGRAGQRIALGLAGIEKTDIERGMCIVDPTLHHPQRVVAVTLRGLPSHAPLQHWTHVHCHLGADDVPARIALLNGDTLPPGEPGLAEIVFEREISVLAGDRFILRDAGARTTCAGGKVLDIFPPARKKRAPERLALLAAMSDRQTSAILRMMAAQAPQGIDLARFALNHNLDDLELRILCDDPGLRVVADTAFAATQWQALLDRIMATLAAEHARQADMPGVEHDRLRRLTLPSLPRPAFDVLIRELLDSARIAQTGAWLHLPEHRIQLARGDQESWEKLKPLLCAEPFNPPRVRDISRSTDIAEEAVRALMKRVARIGEIYPVAHDHYFVAAAVADLAHRVARLCESEGSARAAQLRDSIGGGRKVAIHILEFFDRIGYTRRVRDAHVLRQGGTNDKGLFVRAP